MSLNRQPISWGRSLLIAAFFVAGPVLLFEALTQGALTIEVISPRLASTKENS